MKFLIFLAFGFLALIIQCRCLPIDILEGFAWADDTSLAVALTRVKKDADGIEYVEECKFVDSWQEQPGYINVLAFLDASWEYSHRQADMFKMLQGRLDRSGITGIKFFVINSAEPEATVNNVDIEDEKEAWAETESLHNKDSSSKIEQTREALKEKIGPDIAFVQDDDILKIWEKLSASRDQVIVIDKCGRLSYRVIVPWSILHFPYVKAAILSTYKEQPCGTCDLETTTIVQEIGVQTEKLPEYIPDDWNINQMKEIAAKTYNLDETDETVKKAYHSSESYDIPENIIELLNGSIDAKHKAKTNITLLMSMGDTNFNDSYMNSDSYSANLKENVDVKAQEDLFGINDTLNVSESAIAQSDSDTSSSVTEERTEENEESKTVHSIEGGSSYDNERTDYFDNNHKAHNRESIDFDTSTNVQEEYDEKKNSMSIESSDTSAWLISKETGNQISKKGSDESNSGENSESMDYVMPIRIIMHAPHIHKHEEPTRTYEYLVLKLGNPDFHGHMNDNGITFDQNGETSFENDNNEKEDEDIANEENEEGEYGSGTNEKKKHEHHGTHRGEKASHKHSKRKQLDVVYGKDESPGFYGEDAEYWRNFGNAEDLVKLQIEPPENEGSDKPLAEETNGEDNITTNENNITTTEENTSKYHYAEMNTEYSGPSEEIVESKVSVVNQQMNKNNTEEEEIANRLIIHYSKLIPWLDYVIDK